MKETTNAHRNAGLNPEQRRAVEADGSVAVTAGAGTGKTHMLAKRYLEHVVEHGLAPLEIVAVTFTDKAADELRARIRKELREWEPDPVLHAEVDAAQISTIHALAARICRDFYDVVGIPPAFDILDEIEGPITTAAMFDRAIAAIDPDVVTELGYTWLRAALEHLLNDPVTAQEALEVEFHDIVAMVSEAREAAIAELTASDNWRDAKRVFAECNGSDGDLIEVQRRDVVNAIADIEAGRDIPAALAVIGGVNLRGGRPTCWAEGALRIVKDAFITLREMIGEKGAYRMAWIETGPLDYELQRRLELLRTAFESARDFMAAEKKRQKVLDFNDLEIYALEILEQEEVRRHYAERWKAILVDEFQDTNPVQGRIIRHLCEGQTKVTIVGDEKQSIYGFRHADVEVFTEFRDEITKATGEPAHKLGETFRSHHHLVEVMNVMFAEVLGDDIRQDLRARRAEAPAEGPHVTLAVMEDESEQTEARYIAHEIRRMLEAKTPVYDKHLKAHRPIKPDDIAILSRAWAPVEWYADALLKEGIPAVNAGGGELLATREAKDACAMAGFLADPDDDIPLAAILRGPFFAISDKVLMTFAGGLERKESWWRAMQRTQIPELSEAREVLAVLLKESKIFSAAEVLRSADARTGYSAVIANLPQGKRRLADWEGMIDVLARQARRGRGDVFAAARYIRLLIESKSKIPRPPIDTAGAVAMMTIHKAKGLEWPVVFVPALSRKPGGNFTDICMDRKLGVAFKCEDEDGTEGEPAIMKVIKDRAARKEKEEDKRLLYVAITRARDRVFLSSVKENGNMLDLLKPGIAAAGIDVEWIADETPVKDTYVPGEVQAAVRPVVQAEPLPAGLRSVTASALTEYRRCPLKFKFRFADGHPGLGEGSSRAMHIGTLAHAALEHDVTDADGLSLYADGMSPELFEEALKLAETFHSGEQFAPLQAGEAKREHPFEFTLGGLRIYGTADLVGDDFVVDYKTDSTEHPEEHIYQLWAYAEGLKKSKAYIAYLRSGRLHEYSAEDMRAAAEHAAEMADGILNGRFDATPCEEACRYCNYGEICESRFNGTIS